MSAASSRRPNRLAAETSPYLLQHAHNPVDWYPWGPEALERARREEKPIFLSVGYSACHWCHVMERESFENDAIAAYLNEHFVNIKVDREERPDIDHIYMSAVQAMTGHGGWPMSVFLTPEGAPFYGGTYFPPEDRRGMPGFLRVAAAVAEAWKTRRDELINGAAELTAQLRALAQVRPDGGNLDASLLDRACERLAANFDPRYGGFGAAPKFPHPMDLRLLLRQALRRNQPRALDMVVRTLDHMARGGIYDHLGGGFARYSTDARWLVPHFEKMLYDNALLASTYLEAFQMTGSPEFARVARETMDYVIDRMTDGQGVYATEDADSEGVEGKYYVWSHAEVVVLLGEERARAFCYVYDVTPEGNWEHTNILNLPKPLDQAARMLNRAPEELARELDASRRTLLAARERRVPPGKDTKVIAAWNGLMIAAWSQGWRVLNEPRYGQAAEAAASFLLNEMLTADGRLLHVWKDGKAVIPGFLDDYACVVDGLTRLYEASGNSRWLTAAVRLAERMIHDFADPADGGFFFVAHDHESLIVRTKDATDSATPSGNGMAATALARLAVLTSRDGFAQQALSALRSVRPILQTYPNASGQSLIALDLLLTDGQEIAVFAGDEPQALDAALHLIGSRFLPHAVTAPVPGNAGAEQRELVPWLAGRASIGGQLTTYLCQGRVCQQPAVGLDELRVQLEAAPRAQA